MTGEDFLAFANQHTWVSAMIEDREGIRNLDQILSVEGLTQQFGVPAENLTSQGYGAQYLKEQTSGPSRINRRVTIRRITPLLNGGTASLPPPPPGTAPPR